MARSSSRKHAMALTGTPSSLLCFLAALLLAPTASAFALAPTLPIPRSSLISRPGAFPSAVPLRVRTPECRLSSSRSIQGLRMSDTATDLDVSPHIEYLSQVAKAPAVPDAKRLECLAKVLMARGEKVIAPTEREGVHPYVVPVTKAADGKHVTGLLRVPEQGGTDIQVVRSTAEGVTLLSPSIDKFVKRAAIEEDFHESELGPQFIALATELGLIVKSGAAKAGKLGLEKYLLVNVGPFPDLYEWLANDWLSKGKTEEALISCSRGAGLLPDWGKMHWVHSQILTKVGMRELEARDCARAALQMALWTVGDSLPEVISIAESTEEKFVTSYLKWAETGGPEEQMNNGEYEQQKALGRVRYLLDTVVLVEDRSWDTVREELAQRLEEAQMPDMANFVRN